MSFATAPATSQPAPGAGGDRATSPSGGRQMECSGAGLEAPSPSFSRPGFRPASGSCELADGSSWSVGTAPAMQVCGWALLRASSGTRPTAGTHPAKTSSLLGRGPSHVSSLTLATRATVPARSSLTVPVTKPRHSRHSAPAHVSQIAGSATQTARSRVGDGVSKGFGVGLQRVG